jgi:hypothetical protein
MHDHPKIEIPDFLSHLPIYAGFPIPYSTFVHEGKPDFRVTDMLRWDKCAREKLCGVCGKKLGEFCYFVGGGQTLKYRLFFDPAMHKPCAEFSSKICPFLNGRKTEYRPLDVLKAPEGFVLQKVDVVSDIRPDEMYILKARTSKVDLVRYQGKLLIRAEKFYTATKF